MRLSLSLTNNMSLTRGQSFSPSSLFAGGGLGVWYDPSDLSTVWADTAGTTPASVDGTVARIDDKSGNGRNWTQATATKRPILRQSGSLYYLEFDGTDDGFVTASGLTWPATSDYFCGIRNLADTTYAFPVDGTNTAENLGIAQIGSDTAQAGSIGTPSYWINNATLSPSTRGALYTAIGTTDAKVYEVRDGAVNFSTVQFGDIATFQFAGRIYGMIIAPANASSRANARTWMASKCGISL